MVLEERLVQGINMDNIDFTKMEKLARPITKWLFKYETMRKLKSIYKKYTYPTYENTEDIFYSKLFEESLDFRIKLISIILLFLLTGNTNNIGAIYAYKFYIEIFDEEYEKKTFEFCEHIRKDIFNPSFLVRWIFHRTVCNENLDVHVLFKNDDNSREEEEKKFERIINDKFMSYVNTDIKPIKNYIKQLLDDPV